MKLMDKSTQHTAWEILSTQCVCELGLLLLPLLLFFFQVTLGESLKYCITHSRSVVVQSKVCVLWIYWKISSTWSSAHTVHLSLESLNVDILQFLPEHPFILSHSLGDLYMIP